mmetsp:Transcript_29164/g.34368  ORF Transcript_29164/g.34368 Transcript_29164/m.34368 type:complete len:295 (-) Transcript_29164:178-1062(-)
MSSKPFCDYCSKHKLKVDPHQSYASELCRSCGAGIEPETCENIILTTKPVLPLSSQIFVPPPIHKNIGPLSSIILQQCEYSSIILGGVDYDRKEEIESFWLINYGHPPDGKQQWGESPHRLIAYNVSDGQVVGGIHWQNPKSIQIRSSSSSSNNGGYISAMAVCNHFRNRNIAKILMVAAIEQIKLDGGSSSHLVVTQFGLIQTPHLEQFYNRVGFMHHATRFLTKPILYSNQQNNNKDNTLEKVKIAKNQVNSRSTVTKGGMKTTSTPSPRTGLYILPDIPDDYAQRVFGRHP